MTCKLCDWLHRWLGARCETEWGRIWDNIHRWEHEYSNDWEPQVSVRDWELFEQAGAIEATDPEAAFHIHLQAADAGSPWALRMVAWHYHGGSFVEADHDLARHYYYRAICAGSWTATIPYAQLLAEHGRFDDCDTVLQDGIAAGFIPAYFRLARFRFQQSRSRRTCREIRPWLEYACDRGHPGAKQFLAALMLRGKYGLRQIPAGFRMAGECMDEDEAQEEAHAGTQAPPAGAEEGSLTSAVGGTRTLPSLG